MTNLTATSGGIGRDLAVKLFDAHCETEKAIHSYFGYITEWRVYPLDFCLNSYWTVYRDSVYFADTEDDLRWGLTDEGWFEEDDPRYLPSDEGTPPVYYSNSILSSRGSSGILETPDFTMIRVDTQTDGNKFLQIFDNAKKR